MQTFIQIVGAAIVVAICGCLIRPYTGAVSAALSAVACIMVIVVSFDFLEPVLDILKRMQELSGLSGTVTAPVLKAVGICFLTQIACSVCEDNGEKTLQRVVEVSGGLLAMYLSVPLMTAVLDLLEEMLGG